MWMNGLLELAPKLIVLELRLIRCPPDLSMMGNLRHLDFNVADISRSPALLPPTCGDKFPHALLKTLRPVLACAFVGAVSSRPALPTEPREGTASEHGSSVPGNATAHTSTA